MFRTVPRRLVVACVTGAAAVALVAGAGVATASATVVPAPSSTVALTAATATTPPAHHHGARGYAFDRGGLHRLAKASPALKADLAALKGKTKNERRTGLETIDRKAVAGDYGTTVQTVVTKTADLWKAAPTALQTDVKALKGKTRDQKVAELRVIEAKALAGSYGSTVESDAKAIQSALKTIAPKSTTTPTAAPTAPAA